MAEEPDRIALPLAWVEGEEPVIFANQFLFQQIDPGEFVLNIGQALPPPLIGPPEEQRRQASQIPFVPVRTLARLSLTRKRVEELINVLQGVLTRADEAQGDQ